MPKDEEAVLEIMANMAIKMLIEEKEFSEEWETKVEKRLKKSGMEQKTVMVKIDPHLPSTSGFEEVYVGTKELGNALRSATKTFLSEADLESCQNETLQGHRDSGVLYEVGLKVERICTIEDAKSLEICNQIGCACRRVIHVLRLLVNKFSVSGKLHIGSCYSMSARICDLCYTIAQQIDRYRNEAGIKLNESNTLKEVSNKLADSINTFNLMVVEMLEKSLARFKRKEKTKKSLPKNGIFVSSVQDGIRPMSKMTKHHLPGSIAPSIVSRSKGFLLEDSLYKARSRVPTTSFAKIGRRSKQHSDRRDDNVPASSTVPEEEDLVLKSAVALSNEIIEEIRSSMKLRTGEQLWLGMNS